MPNVLEGEWQIETAAGWVWDLTWPKAGITRIVGIGLPPADRTGQRTPTQHGSAELGFRLADREVIFGFVYKCRDGTLEAARRAGPYKAFSYLASPLILRRATRDHTVFELREVYFGGGLELDSSESWDSGLEFGTARLVCRDPAYYDTTGNSITVPYSDLTHGVYSSTISLDSTDGLRAIGDWYAFPTIAITGPCTLFDLQSTTTGQRVRYYGEIIAGEVVTIVCNPHPAFLSATSTAATGSVEKYIYPEDDFGGFCLWPDPLATDGNNAWELEVFGPGAAFTVTFSWEDRYQGA